MLEQCSIEAELVSPKDCNGVVHSLDDTANKLTVLAGLLETTIRGDTHEIMCYSNRITGNYRHVEIVCPAVAEGGRSNRSGCCRCAGR